ncbi:hypothetical protein, partial [Gluconobacter thailandicus]|uniref:hypothetical protein n=1 Tax=Gluconobacter thailandicus TaxID=257438 RepID=UPI0004978B86
QAGCALRFSRSSDAAPDLDPGQRALLSDLPETGPTALRRFLSRYVVEAVNPRGAAPQVASIWIDSASDRRTPSTMLAKITRSDGLPRLKRDLVSAELELSVSGKSLVDLILKFRDESVTFLPASTRTLLANLDLQQFRQVVTTGSNAVEGTLGRISFDAVILNYDTAALSQIADRETRPAILRERPMIALSQGFWPDEDAERATLIEALPSELAGNANEIMSAMPGTIGPAAAAALTAFVIRTNPQGVSDLMAGADSVMRRATLATISAHPELTAQLLPELRSGDFALLEAIAEALVASGSGLENVMVWVEVVHRVANGQLADLGPYSSVVICALALKLGGTDGLNLALPVFEPTLTSTKRFSLGRDYGRWLERELPSSAKGWSLQMRLRSAAVEAWPPGCGGAGALLLCSQLENSARLVNDVFVHHGRSALEVALLDFRLTRSARRYIKKMLSPPKRRTKMFGF